MYTIVMHCLDSAIIILYTFNSAGQKLGEEKILCSICKYRTLQKYKNAYTPCSGHFDEASSDSFSQSSEALESFLECEGFLDSFLISAS